MGGEHICNQADRFDKIQEMIEEIQTDRKLQDEERDKRLALRNETDKYLSDTLKELSSQMKDLIDLNNEVKDFKAAWRVGKSLGLGLTVIISGLGVIFGGIYALKAWIKN